MYVKNWVLSDMNDGHKPHRPMALSVSAGRTSQKKSCNLLKTVNILVSGVNKGSLFTKMTCTGC